MSYKNKHSDLCNQIIKLRGLISRDEETKERVDEHKYLLDQLAQGMGKSLKEATAYVDDLHEDKMDGTWLDWSYYKGMLTKKFSFNKETGELTKTFNRNSGPQYGRNESPSYGPPVGPPKEDNIMPFYRELQKVRQDMISDPGLEMQNKVRECESKLKAELDKKRWNFQEFITDQIRQDRDMWGRIWEETYGSGGTGYAQWGNPSFKKKENWHLDPKQKWKVGHDFEAARKERNSAPNYGRNSGPQYGRNSAPNYGRNSGPSYYSKSPFNPAFESSFKKWVSGLINSGEAMLVNKQLEVGDRVMVFPFPPGDPMSPAIPSVKSSGTVVNIYRGLVKVDLDNPKEIESLLLDHYDVELSRGTVMDLSIDDVDKYLFLEGRKTFSNSNCKSFIEWACNEGDVRIVYPFGEFVCTKVGLVGSQGNVSRSEFCNNPKFSGFLNLEVERMDGKYRYVKDGYVEVEVFTSSNNLPK